MADRTRPTDFVNGPPCILCGRPFLRPGHNRKERQTLRDSYHREVIASLFFDGRMIYGNR